MGRWVGNYNENEAGVLTIEISKSGNFGSYRSDLISYIYDDGKLPIRFYLHSMVI